MEQFEYILRYYLPVKPYFDEAYTEKRFRELIEFCKDTKTETVMFFCGPEPGLVLYAGYGGKRTNGS